MLSAFLTILSSWWYFNVSYCSSCNVALPDPLGRARSGILAAAPIALIEDYHDVDPGRAESGSAR